MGDRPALVRIDQSADDVEARVVIALAWHDSEFVGEAYGSTAAELRPRLLGEATLRALEALAPGRIQLALDAIATTRLGRSQVAMAQVQMGGTSLVGSALLQDDDPAAAPVRAVLDAVNRKLSIVL